MNRIFSFIAGALALLLVGCDNQPSTLVGIWQAGEPGIVAVQNTLTLEENGKATLHMGSKLSSQSDNYQWKVEDKCLHLTTPAQPDPFGGSYPGKDTAFVIVAQSANALVLQAPTGATFNFHRLGKP